VQNHALHRDKLGGGDLCARLCCSSVSLFGTIGGIDGQQQGMLYTLAQAEFRRLAAFV